MSGRRFLWLIIFVLVTGGYYNTSAATPNNRSFRPFQIFMPQPELLEVTQDSIQIYIPLIVNNPCNGHCYYVDGINGSNANPGTSIDKPWRTIQKAADTVVAGDRVYIKEGTYAERVILKHSGSTNNYITFEPYPGDIVTINGTGISVPVFGGLFHIPNQSYIKVSGLRVINSSGAGIFVETSKHITIENNYTYNTYSSGIGVWNNSNIVIDSNEVELACNNGPQENISIVKTNDFEVKFNEVHNGGPGTNGGEGIDAKDGSFNGKIYGNNVHHIPNRLAIYIDAYQTHTYDIEVYGNVVHDNSNGIVLASEAGGLLENIRVYNNIIYGNQFVGFSMSGCCSNKSAAHPMRNITFINNTLYNNGQDWGGGIRIEAPDIESVVIRNNIASQNLKFQILADTIVPLERITVDYNLVDGYLGNPGEFYGSNYIIGDARFVDASSADFHLKLDSPAIDHGSSTSGPFDDFDYQARPQDGDGNGIALYDLGADEVIP